MILPAMSPGKFTQYPGYDKYGHKKPQIIPGDLFLFFIKIRNTIAADTGYTSSKYNQYRKQRRPAKYGSSQHSPSHNTGGSHIFDANLKSPVSGVGKKTNCHGLHIVKNMGIKPKQDKGKQAHQDAGRQRPDNQGNNRQWNATPFVPYERNGLGG